MLGFVRWSWRGLGEKKEYLDPFVGMIPDLNGLGVLRGGVSFLLFVSEAKKKMPIRGNSSADSSNGAMRKKKRKKKKERVGRKKGNKARNQSR